MTSTKDEVLAEQLEELTEAFDLFDEDGDDRLDAEELTKLMRSFAQDPSSRDIRAMLDEKGKLTYESFINVMRDKISNTNTELAIKQAFDFFDKDGSRTIDAEEFKKVITFLGQHLEDEAAMDLFNDADIDGDGVLTFEEFKNLLCS
ncbi:hypothetical protein Pelo_4680 [Pelomyxa schiedti]|nr:hypothetical protein Pelo_4680 [Pelomyxa schiedti]